MPRSHCAALTTPVNMLRPWDLCQAGKKAWARSRSPSGCHMGYTGPIHWCLVAAVEGPSRGRTGSRECSSAFWASSLSLVGSWAVPQKAALTRSRCPLCTCAFACRLSNCYSKKVFNDVDNCVCAGRSLEGYAEYINKRYEAMQVSPIS